MRDFCWECEKESRIKVVFYRKHLGDCPFFPEWHFVCKVCGEVFYDLTAPDNPALVGME